MRDLLSDQWSRRSFLTASLVGLSALGGILSFPTRGRAQTLPVGRLNLYNVWTGERLAVRYRDDEGGYDPAALADINHLLRCRHNNAVTTMDVNVLEHVDVVVHQIGGTREVCVISGYRSPEYQELLVRRSARAARHSLHVEGKAIDIYIPGVHPWAIREAAMKLQRGGVGYYGHAKFVHLDSGPFRWW